VSKLIYLVRHGQSQGNIEGRVQGWLDSPLSERGQQQAHCLARRLAAETEIHVVVTSPLLRAVDTAKIIANYLKCPLKYDPNLRDYNMGPITGLTLPEIKEKYPERYLAFAHNEPATYLPGEEGTEPFMKRVQRGMERVLAQIGDGQAALVVAHTGTLNICLKSWLEISGHNLSPFEFNNASISVVRVNAVLKWLIRLNDTCHLAVFDEEE
jgi:probable phosphoglycerate mutase